MHAVVTLQGLANKTDRVKNARTGIVQGCPNECAYWIGYFWGMVPKPARSLGVSRGKGLP